MYWAEEEAKYTSKYKSKQAGTHDAVWTAAVPHYVKWVQHRIKAQFLQPKQTKVPETASGKEIMLGKIGAAFDFIFLLNSRFIVFSTREGRQSKQSEIPVWNSL